MNLAKSMRQLLKDHQEVFEKHDRGGNYELAMTCSSIDEFDVALTVPCFGARQIPATAALLFTGLVPV